MDTKITVKGQITLPKEARQHLHVKPGDRLKIFTHPDGTVVILPTRPASALRGLLKTDRRATIEEMNDAIAEAVSEKDRRSRSR